MPDWIHGLLALATLLVGLVAGFLFAFAVVVMPGLNRLPDRDSLRAFQAIDGVIQDRPPLFGLVWAGSALALAVGFVFGFVALSGWERWLLTLAAVLYLLGVQLVTAVVHLPLNSDVQALDLDGLDDASVSAACRRFESKWNRWNRIRTALAAASTALLVVLLLRL